MRSKHLSQMAEFVLIAVVPYYPLGKARAPICCLKYTRPRTGPVFAATP